MSLIFGFSFALGSIFLCVSFKRNELAHQILVYIHDGSVVIKVTAIIFSTENGYQLLVFAEETVAVLHYLMASADQIEVMFLKEFF